MSDRLLHTPDGVRDIFGEECERKLRLQNDLHSVLASYGCRDIETPTFEFFDVFGREIGTTPSRELYKFFDREGNTLVLRPDITPSIARAVSRRLGGENKRLRLCYVGNTFINNSSYQGRLRESTHLGAELIGGDDAQTDAETIAMAADCLKKAGLEEFQIAVGHMEYYKSILREISIDAETEATLRDFISNRNIFGAENLLESLPIDEKSRKALLSLPGLYGSGEVLDRALELASSEGARNAVLRLKEICRILEYYDAARYVSFDLSMLSRYDYYTGVFFRGYTFGSGDAVVKGGRYDRLLSHFGQNAPAIGFVVVADQLLTALNRQNLRQEPQEEPMELTYPPRLERPAVQLAQRLRSGGQAVILTCVQEEDNAKTEKLLCLCREHGITV